MITFRLYDSVPKSVIEQWKSTLADLQTPNGLQTSSLQDKNKTNASSLQDKNKTQTQASSLHKIETRRILKLLDKYEDAGYGQCYLKDDRAAEIVKNALFYYHQVKYEVISWCIMPNHVHVLISLLKEVSLSEILHSWRSFSSNEINKLFNRTGRLWMPEYFDRYIRDEDHFNNVVNYIHNNPVKAGLVDDPTRYRWSSAFVGPQIGGLQTSSLQENATTPQTGLQTSSLQENAPQNGGLQATSLQENAPQNGGLQTSSLQEIPARRKEDNAGWKPAKQ